MRKGNKMYFFKASKSSKSFHSVTLIKMKVMCYAILMFTFNLI